MNPTTWVTRIRYLGQHLQQACDTTERIIQRVVLTCGQPADQR